MNNQQDKVLDLRRFLRQVRSNWWIYLICFTIFMGLGIMYWNIKMPQFTSYNRILIESPGGTSNGGGLGALTGMMRSFSIGGIGSSNTSNELMVLNSREVLDSTIKKLNLYYNYVETDGLKKISLFGKEIPLYLDIPQEKLDTLSSGFAVKVDFMGNKADVEVMRGGRLHKKLLWEADGLTLPADIETPAGKVKLGLTPNSHPQGEERCVKIYISGKLSAAEFLEKEINYLVVDKMADAIEMSLEGSNTEKSEAILNQIVEEYETKRQEQKNLNARQKVEFYQARLQSLVSEMDTQDKKVEQYQNDNKLIDVEAEAQLLASSKVANKQEIAAAQAQLTYAEQLYHTLSNDDKGMLTLPMKEGASNPLLEQYNSALMEKRQLETSAKNDHAAMVNLNRNISEMRSSLMRTLKLQIQEARVNLNSLYALDSESERRINQLPKISREYVNLLRDKTIKDELYLFLMQEHESAMLDLNSNASPAFKIDMAYSDSKPSKTKGILVLVACFVLSILFPTIYSLLRMRSKDEILEPFDLANLGLEGNAVLYNGEKRDAAKLRSLLTTPPETRLTYVADMSAEGGSALMDTLKDSYRRAGLNLVEESISCFSGYEEDNDTLSNNGFIGAAEAKLTEWDYGFIRVPDISRTEELYQVLERPDINLFVIIDRKGIKRKQLRETLKGLPPEKIRIAII